MSKQTRRWIFIISVLLACSGLFVYDIYNSKTGAKASKSTFMKKRRGKSNVVVATSLDKDLTVNYPLDYNKLTTKEVKEIVWHALDMDKSKTNIRNAIDEDDWVLVKLNLVRVPTREKNPDHNRKYYSGFYNPDSLPRWHDETDARVAKAVMEYIVEKIKPRRASFAENRFCGPQYDRFEKSWATTEWTEFGKIVYQDVCDELNSKQNHTQVDIVCFTNDDFRFEPVPGDAFQYTEQKIRSGGGNYGYFVPIPYSGKKREGYYMPVSMLEADKLVNVPAMKCNIGGGTLGFKNYVGGFSHTGFGTSIGAQMDQWSFERGMIDVASYRPSDYTVIAGFYASDHDWTSHTMKLHHNVVISGSDPVAVEATTLRIMGFNPADIEAMHLVQAKGMGFWEEENIKIIGSPVRKVRRNFVKHSSWDGIGFQNYLMNGPHKAADLDEDILGGEADIKPKKGKVSAGKKWWVFKHPYAYPEAYVSLNENVEDDLTNTITYAYVCVKSPRVQQGFLEFGFDDGAKVYLNGEQIFHEDGPKKYSIGEYHIPITLKKGKNHLLIKLKNRYGLAGFQSSLEDSSGTMFYDMEIIIPKEKGMVSPREL